MLDLQQTDIQERARFQEYFILQLGPTLLERVPNPYFGIVPRSSSIGDPTITRAQLMTPYPDYTAVSFYRNNVGTTNYQGLAFSIRQRLSHGLTYSAAYTRSKLTDIARRCSTRPS